MKLSSGSDFSLELDLAHDIVPAQCKTRLMSTKVNIRYIPKYMYTSLARDQNKVSPTATRHFQAYKL